MKTGAAKEIFAHNLNDLMDKKGKSRKAVSAALNVPYTTVCDWANGKTMARADKLEQLAELFNVPIYTLLESRGYEWDSAIYNIPFSATQDEEDLIRKLRLLPDSEQEFIEKYVGAKYWELYEKPEEK